MTGTSRRAAAQAVRRFEEAVRAYETVRGHPGSRSYINNRYREARERMIERLTK